MNFVLAGLVIRFEIELTLFVTSGGLVVIGLSLCGSVASLVTPFFLVQFHVIIL